MNSAATFFSGLVLGFAFVMSGAVVWRLVNARMDRPDWLYGTALAFALALGITAAFVTYAWGR